MHLLVISDSHGNRSAIRRVIEEHPNADMIVFLGDGAKEAEDISAELPTMATDCRDMRILRGNCDVFDFGLENELIFRVDKVTVFACHGHTRMVKSGIDYLFAKARTVGAALALFGHTHEPYLKEEEGIILLNPGSVGLSIDGKCHYAFISINGSEIKAQLLAI